MPSDPNKNTNRRLHRNAKQILVWLPEIAACPTNHYGRDLASLDAIIAANWIAGFPMREEEIAPAIMVLVNMGFVGGMIVNGTSDRLDSVKDLRRSGVVRVTAVGYVAAKKLMATRNW